MKLSAAWATDVGQVRSGNEDAFLVDDALGVFAVADGMGGHRAGEVASSTAVEAVRAALARGQGIDDAIRTANDAVLERAAGNAEFAGMGTTFTAIVPLDGAQVLIGHVGDSRAYLLRDGQLSRLTDDHSLVDQLRRDGRITAEQAEVHPQRSIITRALGIEPDLEVDLYTVRVANGDRLLVCSDGLTDMVREPDLERLAATTNSGPDAASALVDAANLAGGIDNITVILLDVAEIDDDPVQIDHAMSVAATTAGALGSPPPAIADAAAAAAADQTASVPRARRRLGRRSLRALLVAAPLVVILAVAFGVVWWRATHTWFVGEDRGVVVVYRGVPDGLLVWNPEVVDRTDLKTGTLSELDRDRVQQGYCEGTRAGAAACVVELRDRRQVRSAGVTTTVPTSTTAPATTTRARATTTTADLLP